MCQDEVLRVGVKFCGGCNPDYDRVALLSDLEKRLNGGVEFISAGDKGIDLFIAIQGCSTACADLSPFEGCPIKEIRGIRDAAEFIQEIEEGRSRDKAEMSALIGDAPAWDRQRLQSRLICRFFEMMGDFGAL